MDLEKQKGFSLIEFLVVMTLIVILFAAAFQIFVPVVRRSKVETGNIQTQIEGIIGLELLRRDVIHAGNGLPWTLPTGLLYQETTDADRSPFNDSDAGAPVPPRSLVVQNNAAAPLGINNSDYLVIKSSIVANPVTPDGTNYVGNPACEKWTTVTTGGAVRLWGSDEDDLHKDDRVVVLQPSGPNGLMELTSGSTSYFTKVSDVLPNIPIDYAPTAADTYWYVFGIDSTTDLSRPFNRADYYISTQNVPSRCAPGTGVLVKSVLHQNDGAFGDELPLLECVASFQVVLGVDEFLDDQVVEKNCLTNDLGSITGWVPSAGNISMASFTTAREIRNRVQEVRLYILAQEGEFDTDYRFSNYTSGTSILVGENDPNNCDSRGVISDSTQSCDCSGSDSVLGVTVDLSTLGPYYDRYRWRVYRMVLKTETTIVNAGG